VINIEHISTQLLFTTVPIWVELEDSSRRSGTGLLFSLPTDDEARTIPFLLTNYHVVQHAQRIVTQFLGRENEQPDINNKISVELPANSFTEHVDRELDLAVVPVGPLLNHAAEARREIFYRTVDPSLIPDQGTVEKLSAIEEVTFIGYPSGLYDVYNASPIIRRGITATPVWNDFNSEPKFLIDAGVFPGSSGSPVFIYNQGSYSSGNDIVIGSRLYFLGILSQALVRLGEGTNEVQHYLGLGAVVKSSKVLNYLQSLERTLN
jgi:hypothetical protein